MKIKKIVICLFLVSSMVIGCSKPPVEKDLKTIGQTFAQDMIEGKDVSSSYSFDSAMMKLVQDGSLKQMVQESLTPYGKLVEVKEVSIEGNNVQIPATFEKMALVFTVGFNDKQEIQSFTFNFDKTATVLPENVVEEEVILKIDDTHSLGGTLTMPKGMSDVPVVILVQGSGASSRDEEVGPISVFKDFAWGLAEKGIATYRYDKRTYVYGNEIAKDINFTVYDETVNDAISAVEMMKKQNGVDSTQVYVLGHSLGGYMMPRIAEKANVAGYIMAAAPVTSMVDLMAMQIEFLSSLTKKVNEKTQYALMQSQLDKLRDLTSIKDDEVVLGGYKAYWSDLNDYQPLELAKQMKQPVLVLQGEEDYQVPLEEMETWKTTFGENSQWTFKSYSGLTHLFTPGEKKNGSADYAVPAHVDSRVFDDIATFILNK